MTKKRVIGYIRVSSQEQVNEGESLRRQEEMIRSYCSLKSLENVEIIADKGMSGFKDNRDGFQQLKSLCQSREVSTVIVFDLSRLSRSVRTTLEFIEDVIAENGIDFVSLTQQIDTSTPMGTAFLAITSVFNQLYRDEISFKTKKAKAYKKANNEKASKFAPFGFEPDLTGKLVASPKEQETLSVMKNLRQKNMPYKSIANFLNHNGHKTKSGKGQWYAPTVKAILDREIGAL